MGSNAIESRTNRDYGIDRRGRRSDMAPAVQGECCHASLRGSIRANARFPRTVRDKN